MADEVARVIAESAIILAAANQIVATHGIIPEARRDAVDYLKSQLVLCDDGQLLGPGGKTAAELLIAAKDERTHWWPKAQTKEELADESDERILKLAKLAFGKNEGGVGARLKAQGDLVRLTSADEAKRIAAQWGTSLGSTERGRNPNKKPKSSEEVYDDSVKADDKSAKRPIGTATHERNPWSRSAWNITKQASIYKSLGKAKAEEFARAAGSELFAVSPPSEKE